MNDRLFLHIHGWAGNDALDAVMHVIAVHVIFLVFLATAILVLRQARHRPSVLAWALVALGTTFGLKLVLAAARPQGRPFERHQANLLFDHDPGQSFPSNHATAAFACSFLVLLFIARAWGAALLAVAALIGFARIYGGVHYPGDIAAGFVVALVGASAAAGIARLSSRFRSTYSRRRGPPSEEAMPPCHRRGARRGPGSHGP